MKFSPYLNFKGNAEEAFKFYRSVFGGEFTSIMRFKDMPQDQGDVAEEDKNRIMHISLSVSPNFTLMASDISLSQEKDFVLGNNNYIFLNPETLSDAETLFKKLSSGGIIEMPFGKTFWGDYFGSFIDKYGVHWMIDIEDKN